MSVIRGSLFASKSSMYVNHKLILQSGCLCIWKRWYARRIPTDSNDYKHTDRIPSRLKRRLAKAGMNSEEMLRSSTTKSLPVKSITPNLPPSSSSEFPKTSVDLERLVADMTLGTPEASEKEEFPSDIKKYQDWRRDQSRKAFRPKVDPASTSLILFPGQGSQFVGMGKNTLGYGKSKELYEEASEILKYDLLKMCLSGPLTTLSKTIHCQPAVMVTSLAAVEKLMEQHPEAIESCVGTAGFSIGEYAALVFAGVLTFADAVHLVHIRAEEMQKASEIIPSGMMTAFLSHDSKLKTAMLAAREYCHQRCNIPDPVCTIANYLYPECKVIAGNMEALDFIEKNSKSFNIRRTKRLPVSGAFHTNLMESAKKPLREILQRTTLSPPQIPVYSNVTAAQFRQQHKILELLQEQVTAPVKWEQIMHVMYSRKQGEGFPQTYEMGPGSQLGTLLKLVNLKAHSKYTSVDV